MDAFVRQLVTRLLDPETPMSRNRHFHTFTTPEGKLALKVSRRLRSFERDLSTSFSRGATIIHSINTDDGSHDIEIVQNAINARRATHFSADDFELLQLLPSVNATLAAAKKKGPTLSK